MIGADSGTRTHTPGHRNLNPTRLPIPSYPHILFFIRIGTGTGIHRVCLLWYPAATSPDNARLCLADHCHALSSLHPPPAALASLPNSTMPALDFYFTMTSRGCQSKRLTSPDTRELCIQKVRQWVRFTLDIPECGLYNRFGIVYAVLGVCSGFSVSLITGVNSRGKAFYALWRFARYELGTARFLFMRKLNRDTSAHPFCAYFTRRRCAANLWLRQLLLLSSLV